MAELAKGPTGRRRGRGARERILRASQQLFREQGINRTGMDQLCAAAQVSKRTAYEHFTGKDELVAEYLRRFDPSVLSDVQLALLVDGAAARTRVLDADAFPTAAAIAAVLVKAIPATDQGSRPPGTVRAHG